MQSTKKLPVALKPLLFIGTLTLKKKKKKGEGGKITKIFEKFNENLYGHIIFNKPSVMHYSCGVLYNNVSRASDDTYEGQVIKFNREY